ncbi:hypothetical protein GW17_00006898 [Ensete ventricosum]|nr:hypothetical protein GW17_00006898 [Ensete ventricosum]
MGLITSNRTCVCISVSPCPVIVDLVIIGFVGSSCLPCGLTPSPKGEPPWVPPLQVLFSQAPAMTVCEPATLIGGLAMVDHPCRWPDRPSLMRSL